MIACARASATCWPSGTERCGEAHRPPRDRDDVKGQAIPAYDPRGLKGMGMAYATSNRGACHLRAYTPASELGLIEPKTDPLAWKGKGELHEDPPGRVLAFSDSLDLCKFSAFAEGPEEYAAQYAAITGRAVHSGRRAEDRRADLQPGAALQQPGRVRRGLRHAPDALPGGAVDIERLEGRRSASCRRCWTSTTAFAAGTTASSASEMAELQVV